MSDPVFYRGRGLDVAAVVLAGGMVLGFIVSAWKSAPPTMVCTQPATPAPAPVETTDARQERLTHQLCDKEVEAILHEKDLAEIIRAATIIHQVNCGIEQRL